MRVDVTNGSRIIFNGTEYKFRERRNNQLDWVSEHTRDLVTLSDSELLEGTSDGTIILQEPGVRYDSETHLEVAGNPDRKDGSHSESGRRLRADTANQLTGKDRLAYVKEAQAQGLHLKRNQAKLSEVADRIAKERGDKIPPSFKTIGNWLDKSGPTPTAKRLSSYHHLKGNRERRYGPEILEIIDNVINEKFLVLEPIPKTEVKTHVLNKIRTLNKTRSEPLEEVGDKVIRNQINLLRIQDILSAQKGPTIAYSKEGNTSELPDPARPLERVEIDHTIFDIIVVDPENGLPIGRPTFAVAIDRCTRMPFGVHLSFDPPSLLTVMECLKNGMLAKSYLEKMKNDPDRPWNIKRDWPVGGIPHSLVVDLARENVSEDLRNFAFRVGINEVHFMPGRSPWFKGAIERFIGTTNRKLAHTSPGTTFSNTLQKADYDSQARAIVTLDELYEALHKWLIDIYQYTPHGGIRRTPRKAWEDVNLKTRIKIVTDRREIDAVIGRSERSSMRRTGIKLQHLTFQSAEYGNFRDSEECRKMKGTDGKIPFLYDPGDLSEVRIVRKNGDILHVPISRKWEKYAKGLSIWQHGCVTAYLNAENRKALSEDDLIQAKVELYELMRKLGPKRKVRRGQGTNARAERFIGTGRRSYSGADTEIDGNNFSDAPVFAAVPPDPQPVVAAPKANRQKSAARNNVVQLSNKSKPAPAKLPPQEYDPYAARGPKSA